MRKKSAESSFELKQKKYRRQWMNWLEVDEKSFHSREWTIQFYDQCLLIFNMLLPLTLWLSSSSSSRHAAEQVKEEFNPIFHDIALIGCVSSLTCKLFMRTKIPDRSRATMLTTSHLSAYHTCTPTNWNRYQSNRRVFAELDRFQISDIKEKRFGVELKMVEIDSIECQE